ncbi:MAG: hypothetical protein FIB03_05275 [Anaerolineae bacterium]|nr:hypothetical protein [Anaerolineae bacterium]
MTDMEFEKQIRILANGMEYPRTPNIAGDVTRRLRSSIRPRFISRKLAWSLTIILVLFSSLMLIPPARAAILEFIQIGIVRIFPQPATPTIEAVTTATPQSIPTPASAPGSDSQLLFPFLDNIAGETKLANAQLAAPYPILLPTYPPELGQPNHVYIQDANGVMTILVWVDPQQPELVTMSLHFIPTNSWAINKMGPVVIRETQVSGQRAIWAVGPYPMAMRDGNIEITRLIDGHVLIWADGNITYRLETGLSLEEAVKVAESLRPIP